MSCPLCERIRLLEGNQYPYLIHEFKHSYLVLGEHQFYQGYSVLITKTHYREMTDIPPAIQNEFFQEMMSASQAIQAALNPKKMNMCSLGNVVDHLHWHFFPRYQDDPSFQQPPWLQMHLFDNARVAPSETSGLRQLIKDKINTL
jgi:diadenosine tetraphosphate (Ap4A) HIT family hydrolase